MLTTLGLIILLLAFLKFLPSNKLRLLSLIYISILYLILSGIEGFVFAGPNNEYSSLIYFSFFFIVLIFHIPLFIRLSKVDHNAHKLKAAREIFGKDIEHLDNTKLHSHLNH